MLSSTEHFSLEKEDVWQPVICITIIKFQQNNQYLIETATFKKDSSIKHVQGAHKKYSLICSKHKIVIPKLLGKQVVE